MTRWLRFSVVDFAGPRNGIFGRCPGRLAALIEEVSATMKAGAAELPPPQ